MRLVFAALLCLWSFSAFAQQNGTPEFSGLGIGVPAPANGVAGDFSGGSITATGTSTPRTSAARAIDQANVLDFGAACDGATDDTTAITNALNSGVGVVIIPASKTCYSASGITVPNGVTLVGGGFHWTHTTPIGTTLLCAASVTNCLTGSGMPSGEHSYSIKDLIVEFSGTAGTAAGTCIYINGGERVYLEGVIVYNCHEGYYFYSFAPQGVIAYMLHDDAGQVNDAYVVQDNFNELHITDSRFGGAENNSVAYIRQTSTQGGATFMGSLYLTQDQFNSGGTQYFMQMVNCATCGAQFQDLDVQISNIHVEQVTQALFYSDASWTQLAAWSISNSSFGGSAHINAYNQPAFALNPATGLNNITIHGNTWWVHDFTLAPTAAWSGVSIVGNSLMGVNQGAVTGGISLTSNSGSSVATFASNAWIGAFTIAGPWNHLAVVGNVFSGGSLTDTTSNGVIVLTPNNEVRIIDSQYVVSALPSCSSTSKGLRALVTDATAATFNSVPVGGGSNAVHVWCNGTNWVEGY